MSQDSVLEQLNVVAPVAPTSVVEAFASFDDMNLPEKLLRGIYSFGFEKPSEIQKRAIMPIAQGRDVLAQAQSGTGKTGTFTIGSLARIDPALDEVQIGRASCRERVSSPV